MKNRTTKLLAVLLSATIIGAALTACGSKTDTSSASDSNTSAQAPAEEIGEITAESILAGDYSKKMKVTYAGWPVQEGFDYTSANDYYTFWSDTFNIEWEVTGLTFENWNERMNTWINADDLPDWSVWNFNAGDAANYVEQGLIKKLPDNWREKYPHLAAMSEYAEENKYYEDLYGGMYFLFRPLYASNFPADTLSAHYSIHLRSDWAEQAGYDLSKNIETRTMTVSEWFDYMRAVKAAGLCEYPWYGITNEIAGYSIGYISDHNYGNSSVYYLADDGTYHWGPGEESSGIKQALGMVKQAYDEGLIYPEFYNLSGCEEYFDVSGDAATILYNGLAYSGDSYDVNFQANMGLSYYDVCESFALVDDEGVFHGDPTSNWWCTSIFSPEIDDEKLDRLLTMMDYGCTEEGQLRIFCGVPGVDWDYDENGELISLLGDEYPNINEKYTTTYPIISGMFVLDNDFGFINPTTSKKSIEIFSKIFQAKAEAANYKGKSKDFFLTNYSSSALNIANMNYFDEFASLILKDGDFNANYDKWVQEKLPLIQPALDDMNAQYAAQNQ